MPHTILTQYTTAPDNGSHVVATRGMFQDILKHLQYSLNFTVEVRLPPQMTFGRLKEGKWIGLIGMLVDGKADIVTGGTGTGGKSLL